MLLPSIVRESSLRTLLGRFAALDGSGDDITLDFQRVQYWIPGAVAFVCSMVNRWRQLGRRVSFANLDRCQALGFLKGADFLDRVGFCIPDNVRRHNAECSLVEIEAISPGTVRLYDPIARRLAQRLAGTPSPTDNVLRFAEYSLGEVIANCQQHSGAPGCIAAQFANSARIGMADYGIGILDSFRSNDSPHYRLGMTHCDALMLCLTPWVSSKTHLSSGPYGQSPNRGVGLSMLRHMVAQCFGNFYLASGDAWLFQRGSCEPILGVLKGKIPGIVLAIDFDRGQIDSFQAMLTDAQRAMDLTDEADDAIFTK